MNDEVIWKAVAWAHWPFIAHKHEMLKDYDWKQYHIERYRVASNWDEHKCKVNREEKERRHAKIHVEDERGGEKTEKIEERGGRIRSSAYKF